MVESFLVNTLKVAKAKMPSVFLATPLMATAPTIIEPGEDTGGTKNGSGGK